MAMLYTGDNELSENQQLFVKDAEEQGYKINFNYSGRGMYGKTCPSIVTHGIADFRTEAGYSYDNMGMDFVIYAKN